MNEKDYQRKKNKFLPKIHAWYFVKLNILSVIAYYYFSLQLVTYM